jgi:hypothetical protein
MPHRRTLLATAALVALLLPGAAGAQQSFEFRNVCGGTTFVFCGSVRLEQAGWSPYHFTLGLMNHSGAVKGYRGAVITEVRFEGVDRPDRTYTSGMDGSSHFHPGPLHTDFLDGEVAPPFDNYGFRGEYTNHPLLGIMSFRASRIGGRTAASPPWGLGNGVASSCGEDLFDSALALFVSASCGYGSGALVRTHERYPYDTSAYSPWTTSWLEDWDGLVEGPYSGRTDVPTYDFRSAGLTLVAQDVSDPSRISVCRLGSASCAVVTPEPGTAPLLAGFLLLLGVLVRRSGILVRS